MADSALPPPQLRQEPQDLEIQPHERHHQRERGVPLGHLGGACLDAALDEVEIDDEVERRHGHHEEAEQDADGGGLVDQRQPAGRAQLSPRPMATAIATMPSAASLRYTGAANRIHSS